MCTVLYIASIDFQTQRNVYIIDKIGERMSK